jgi:hypothetical protein
MQMQNAGFVFSLVRPHISCARSAKKIDAAKAKLERTELRLHKKEINKTDKSENKTIALSTSKLNYLDPRISVAWCKKHSVPLEKVAPSHPAPSSDVCCRSTTRRSARSSCGR